MTGNKNEQDVAERSKIGAFYGFASTLCFKCKSGQFRRKHLAALWQRLEDWLPDDAAAFEIVQAFADQAAVDPIRAGTVMLERLGQWMDGHGITADAPSREETLRSQTVPWPDRGPDTFKERRRRRRKGFKRKAKSRTPKAGATYVAAASAAMEQKEFFDDE